MAQELNGRIVKLKNYNPMSLYKMFKSGEEEFEKKFPFSIIEPITSHNLKSHIKQFIKQEYISIIKEEIARLESEKKVIGEHGEDLVEIIKTHQAIGFNQAIDDQISHLQSELLLIEEDK